MASMGKDDEEMGFEEMGLDSRLLQAIVKRGITKPTPIQLKAIPFILEGKDVVARAKTGSGKTLAYLLPLVHKILGDDGVGCGLGPNALVLVPTRELCQQVHDDVLALFGHCGGTLMVAQLTTNMTPSTLRAVMAGPPNVVVATPARISACIAAEIILPSALKKSLYTLVLDEADLLLSYGYEDDLKKLAPHIPHHCQCLLMSATSSADVDKLKKLILHNPMTLTLMEDEENDSLVPKAVQQFLIYCKPQDKLLYTLALLRFELVQKKALIFVNTVDTGFRLKLFLEQFGVKSAVLNAELPQNSRLHILQEFNVGLFDYLIATDDGKLIQASKDATGDPQEMDEGSQAKKSNKKHKKAIADAEFGVVRGIDFKNVRTVINYDMPLTAFGYVHRIGRTGRAGSSGISVSLVSQEEQPLLCAIEEILTGDPTVGVSHHVVPFPLLSRNAVESIRYRGEDVARSVTKIAVREARAKELRMEIMNSEKLKAHFEDNPTDLELLKHDKVLSKKQPPVHLRTVPDYLQDPTTAAASRAIKIARAAIGLSQANYAKRTRRKSHVEDPLKTFSAQSKKRKLNSGGRGASLGREHFSGHHIRKSKDKLHSAKKQKSRKG